MKTCSIAYLDGKRVQVTYQPKYVLIASFARRYFEGFRMDGLGSFSFNIDTGLNTSALQHFIEEFDPEVEGRNIVSIGQEVSLKKIKSLHGVDLRARIGSFLHNKLLAFQKNGVEKAIRFRKFLLADEPGLGKTIQSIAVAEYFQLWPVLVIVPKSGIDHWAGEIKAANPDRGIMTHNRLYSGIERGKANYYVYKPSELPRLRNRFPNLYFPVVFLDEAHEYKNHRTKRAREIRGFVQGAVVSGLLTGTPIVNEPADLITPLILLDRIRKFGSVQSFGQRYCNAVTTYFGTKYQGAANLPELHSKLESTCLIARTKNDVVTDLPQKRFEFHFVELSNRDHYEKVSNKGLNIQWIGESNLRLVCGQGKVTAAIEWIKSFLENTNKKLVVFACHNEIIRSIGQYFDALIMTGEHSQGQRRVSVARFQNDPSVRVFVVNYQVGGTVHTLTAASDVLLVEFPFTPAEVDQAVDRTHRIGQKTAVTAHFLVASNTIDVDLLSMIKAKKEFQLPKAA